MDRAGREMEELEVSMLGPLVLLDGDTEAVRGFPAVVGGSRDEIVDALGRYEEAGLDHALTIPAYRTPNWDVPPDQQMQAMAELAEIVEEIR